MRIGERVVAPQPAEQDQNHRRLLDRYIEDNALPYPGIYDSPIGKLEGADPWVGVSMTNAARHGLNGYDLIWDYDPTPLLDIAAWHEPPRRYIEGRP